MAPQGFTVEDHDLTLYGRCSDCARPTHAARRPVSKSPTTHRQRD
jgi:Fur family ferric uptake transcriptional regulator